MAAEPPAGHRDSDEEAPASCGSLTAARHLGDKETAVEPTEQLRTFSPAKIRTKPKHRSRHIRFLELFSSGLQGALPLPGGQVLTLHVINRNKHHVA